MRVELDEKELVKIIKAYFMENFGVHITHGKDIRISSKSYQSLAAVVTIEDAPIDAAKET